jgi:hypothetical protein
MKDNSAKLSDELKKKANDAISMLQKELEGKDNVDSIKEKLTQLTTVSSELGQEIYKQAGANNANAQNDSADTNNKDASNNSKDDAVEAEIVDEDKNNNGNKDKK